CPECSKEFLLWDAMDKDSGRLGSIIDCPHCTVPVRRSLLAKMGSEPAWIAYESSDGRRHEKAPDAADLKRALSSTRKGISAWYPRIAMGPDREMYIRCAL